MTPVSIVQGDGGRRIEVSRDLDAPPAGAWDLLVDPDRWPAWGPSVRAVDCDDDRIREGSTGRVQIPGGLWIPFEITSLTEPSTDQSGRWRWRVLKVPATGHRVESLGENRSRVVFVLPLVAAGYVPVCRRALDRIEREL